MSPITSNAPDAPAVAAAEATALRGAKADPDAAAAQFEGMLFAGALAPLSQELGVLGDELTSAVATAVARGQHDEFYRRLRSLVDGSATDDASRPNDVTRP